MRRKLTMQLEQCYDDDNRYHQIPVAIGILNAFDSYPSSHCDTNGLKLVRTDVFTLRLTCTVFCISSSILNKYPKSWRILLSKKLRTIIILAVKVIVIYQNTHFTALHFHSLSIVVLFLVILIYYQVLFFI